MHKSVLLHETIEGIKPIPKGIYVDGTLNDGGHSKALAELLGGKCTIIGFDSDNDALKRGVKEVSKTGAEVIGIHSNFRHLGKELQKIGKEKINGAIFDLGLSSNQLEDSGRGFSFLKDEPLLMTFDANPKEGDLTAKDIVNSFSEENIELIIRAYGEETFSKRIAKAICKVREEGEISTTKELERIISSVVPAWYRKKKIHPATKTFQALRVAVNDEIESLKEGLRETFERLSSGGRIAVISFESVTDREVKQYFKSLALSKVGLIITKKPVIATRGEIVSNPRSRSAKLRIIEKI